MTPFRFRIITNEQRPFLTLKGLGTDHLTDHLTILSNFSNKVYFPFLYFSTFEYVVPEDLQQAANVV